MYKRFAAVAALTLAPVYTSVSQAAFVNLTTSQVIWRDTFEPPAVIGETPALNAPAVGVYTTNTAGLNNTIVVNNATTGGFAAYDGTQFLTMTRGSSGATQAINTPAATGLTAKTLAVNLGDQVSFKFGLRVEDFGKVGTGDHGSVASIFIYNSEEVEKAVGTPPAMMQLNFYGEGAFGVGKGNIRNVSTGQSATNLTSAFIPSAWNTVELLHTVGTSNWTLILNDGAPVMFQGNTATAGSVADMFHMRAGANGTSFSFDTVVPEPGSLALASLTSLALLARRRGSVRSH